MPFSRFKDYQQFLRFCLVGAVGFALNIIVYTILVHAGLDYQICAVLSWCLAVTSNFTLNRQWTFGVHTGAIHFQALRFVCVSLIALSVNLLLLTFFIEETSLANTLAQALAIICVTPLNFLGNRIWSFRGHLPHQKQMIS